MKSLPLLIDIAQPCAQDWHAMAPSHNGRHCAACQQTVTDFTLMSDAEMVAYLSRSSSSGSSGCGRFRAEQLNRPLTSPKAAPRWRTWVAAAVALLSLRALASQPASGQSTSTTAIDASSSLRTPHNKQSESPVTITPDSLIVRGRVVDKESGAGLPGVSIFIEGTRIGISTVADGTFALNIPDSSLKNHALIFSSIGFVTEEKSMISFASPGAQVALSADVKGGFEYRYPAPWHPWSLWQRLTRPFRR